MKRKNSPCLQHAKIVKGGDDRYLNHISSFPSQKQPLMEEKKFKILLRERIPGKEKRNLNEVHHQGG